MATYVLNKKPLKDFPRGVYEMVKNDRRRAVLHLRHLVSGETVEVSDTFVQEGLGHGFLDISLSIEALA